jgi:hypothetical protein
MFSEQQNDISTDLNLLRIAKLLIEWFQRLHEELDSHIDERILDRTYDFTDELDGSEIRDTEASTSLDTIHHMNSLNCDEIGDIADETLNTDDIGDMTRGNNVEESHRIYEKCEKELTEIEAELEKHRQIARLLGIALRPHSTQVNRSRLVFSRVVKAQYT